MRKASLYLGIILVIAIWAGPLPGAAKGSFAAHMLMHMGIVAVAAAFLAIGLAGSRLDLALKAPRVISPIPTSILEMLIVWAWHAPGLHHFARSSTTGLVLEQGLFLCSGFLVWISALGGGRPLARERAAAGVVGLLLTSMHMTLLGALLALAPRALFAHHHSSSLPPLTDQHLGGAIMLLVGGVSYLLGGLWLTVCLLRPRSQAMEAVS